MPGRRETIVWTNDGILLIAPLETNFRVILIEVYTFLLIKMHSEILSTNRGHVVQASTF